MKLNTQKSPLSRNKPQLACFGYYDLNTDRLQINYTALISDVKKDIKKYADKEELAALGKENVIFAWAIHRHDCKLQMGASAYNIPANLNDHDLQNKIFSKLCLFVMKNHDAFDKNKPFTVLDRLQVN